MKRNEFIKNTGLIIAALLLKAFLLPNSMTEW